MYTLNTWNYIHGFDYKSHFTSIINIIDIRQMKRFRNQYVTARLLTHEVGDRVKYGLPDDLPQDLFQGQQNTARTNDKLNQSSTTEKSAVRIIL